jgi:hypothetical protein
LWFRFEVWGEGFVAWMLELLISWSAVLDTLEWRNLIIMSRVNYYFTFHTTTSRINGHTWIGESNLGKLEICWVGWTLVNSQSRLLGGDGTLLGDFFNVNKQSNNPLTSPSLNFIATLSVIPWNESGTFRGMLLLWWLYQWLPKSNRAFAPKDSIISGCICQSFRMDGGNLTLRACQVLFVVPSVGR